MLYFDMNDEIVKICGTLEYLGIGPGQRVAVCTENRREFASLTIACWTLGVVVVPLSTRYTESQIKQALKDFSCDRIILIATLGSINTGIPEIMIDDVFGDCQIISDDLLFSDFDFDLSADASIILTSGSSASPKGVLHTIGNHYYSALGSNENIPFGAGDCWAMSLPMYHISGFSLIMRSLVDGGSIYYPTADEDITETVMHERLTHISLVPAQLIQLLKNKKCVEHLKKYKAILIGGSAIPEWVIKEALDNALPIYTTYGSTESASQLFTTHGDDLKEVINTSGRLLKYREAMIAGDGEILVKGKTLFKGYVKADGIKQAVNEESWFHTGDLGSIDSDGRLFVTGRKDRMFISGGENIHPRQIEIAIENIENVERAVVVPVGDKKFGKRPAAFIEMKNGADLNPKKIKNSLKKVLESFKIPEIYRNLPENTNNPILSK